MATFIYNIEDSFNGDKLRLSSFGIQNIFNCLNECINKFNNGVLHFNTLLKETQRFLKLDIVEEEYKDSDDFYRLDYNTRYYNLKSMKNYFLTNFFSEKNSYFNVEFNAPSLQYYNPDISSLNVIYGNNLNNFFKEFSKIILEINKFVEGYNLLGDCLKEISSDYEISIENIFPYSNNICSLQTFDEFKIENYKIKDVYFKTKDYQKYKLEKEDFKLFKKFFTYFKETFCPTIENTLTYLGKFLFYSELNKYCRLTNKAIFVTEGRPIADWVYKTLVFEKGKTEIQEEFILEDFQDIRHRNQYIPYTKLSIYNNGNDSGNLHPIYYFCFYKNSDNYNPGPFIEGGSLTIEASIKFVPKIISDDSLGWEYLKASETFNFPLNNKKNQELVFNCALSSWNTEEIELGVGENAGFCLKMFVTYSLSEGATNSGPVTIYFNTPYRSYEDKDFPMGFSRYHDMCAAEITCDTYLTDWRANYRQREFCTITRNLDLPPESS